MNNVISIKAFDDILDALQQQGKDLKDVDPQIVDAHVLKAYKYSKRFGYALLDFTESTLGNTEALESIAKTLRKYGITEFTISTFGVGAIGILSDFQRLGIMVQGTTTVEEHRVPPNSSGTYSTPGSQHETILMKVAQSRLTQEEFMQLFSDYQEFLRQADTMKRELVRAISRIEGASSVSVFSEDEADEEHLLWCKTMLKGLQAIHS